MFRFTCSLAAVLLLAVTVLQGTPACADAALVARGRAIAKANCSRCHAIGTTGPSANPKSPPFRYLARKYPLSDLEEALSEGIMVGHRGAEMPHFQFSPAQTAALLAYLASVQEK